MKAEVRSHFLGKGPGLGGGATVSCLDLDYPNDTSPTVLTRGGNRPRVSV